MRIQITLLVAAALLACGASSTSLGGSNGTHDAVSGASLGGTGLTGEYFGDMTLSHRVLRRTDAQVSFDWTNTRPAPAVPLYSFSVRWTGQVVPRFTETYTFTTRSDDGVRLWVDGHLVVDNWTDHAPTDNSGTVTLRAGHGYDLKMEFYQHLGRAVAGLSWASPSQRRQIVPSVQLFPITAPSALPPPLDGGSGGTSTAGAGAAPVGTGCVTPSVTVTASMSSAQIQSVLDTQPPGALICFSSGVYHLDAALSPRNNQTLHGSPDTVLKGSVVLNNPSASGSAWVFTGVPLLTSGPDGAAVQWCEDNVAGPCAYQEDVFLDGSPLMRVTSRGAVLAGTYYTDYGTHQVYVGTNPWGRTVEIAHTGAGIRVSQSGVTVEGFVVEMFAHAMDRAGLEVSASGSNVTVRNNESRYNHGSGLCTWGANTRIAYNRFHDNGQVGAQAGLNTGVVVDHNDFIHNNIDGFWRIDGAAGGLKLDLEKNSTVTSNLARDNLNHGIWLDDNSDNSYVADNEVINNFSSGIQVEISRNARVINNQVSGNALGDPTARGHVGCRGLGCSAGILISESDTVEIAGNRIFGNLNAISVLSTSRSSRSSQITIPSLAYVNVHDNDMTLGSGAVGLQNQGPPGYDAYASDKKNVFVHNTYRLSSAGDALFYWRDQMVNSTAWRAYGEDVAGTFGGP